MRKPRIEARWMAGRPGTTRWEAGRSGSWRFISRSIWGMRWRTASLAIGLNTFQKVFVGAVIVVAPFYAAYLIWRGRWRTGGAVLALSMAGALVFGVYYHFVLPGPDHVTHVQLPMSFAMRDIFDVTAVLLALFECLGVLAGVRIFSKS